MKGLCIFALLVAACAAACVDKDQKPNVLFILADDLGWNDVSWHNDEVLTPRLDAMRKAGIELDQNYAQPVCTPSRHALMTGMYPFHSGMQSGVVFPDHKECAPLDQRFVGQDMKELGYDTHMVGKWHLGFCDEKCLPTNRGFDTFYGFYNGYIDHISHMHGETGVAGYDFHNGTEAAFENEGVHDTDAIRARSEEIIEFHDSDNPLYMYITFGAVHSPLQAPEEFVNQYPEDMEHARKVYLGMVSHMDDAIGQIVDKLEAKGMMDNTVIIFAADNGGEAPTASNLPFRSAKGSFFEGGIKSAGLVYSPKHISAPGTKVDGLVHMIDWLPTIVTLGGGEPRAELDGKNQCEMILNGGESTRDEFVINIDDHFPQTLGNQGIRSGDFKLIRGYPGMVDGYGADVMPTYIRCGWDMYGPMDPTKTQPQVRHRRGSYTMTAEQTKMQNDCVKTQASVIRLFNLVEDPLETTNIAESNPEKVDELVAKLDAHIENIRPAPEDIWHPVAEADPANFGGVWSHGWCKM